MKNNRTNLRLSSFSLLFCLTIAVSLGSGFSVSAPASCNPPEAGITERSGSSVSFAWASVSGATEYKIYYTRQEDVYTSSPVTTGSTAISFSNLPSGTYDFYFCTICGENTSTSFVIDDLMM